MPFEEWPQRERPATRWRPQALSHRAESEMVIRKLSWRQSVSGSGSLEDNKESGKEEQQNKGKLVVPQDGGRLTGDKS
jgi:hypothetical protein